MRNSGIRFLQNYKGADAFKNSYLRASEFSGAGSVVKGNNRIITLVMGEDLPELVTYRLQS